MPRITREMFGAVTKKIGYHEIDIENLLKPFTGRGSIAYLFCKGCGILFEITKKDAISIVDKKIEESDSFIETDGCELCDGKNNNYKVRKIKELLQ